MRSLILAALLLTAGGCSTLGLGDSPAERYIRESGIHKFRRVDSLAFTFNVERAGQAPVKRSWIWRPHDHQVTRIADDQSVTYNRHALSDESREVDKQFINDTFWLLPALHLAWAGDDVTITDHGQAALPVGLGYARRVTVAYPPDGGGYTPGDVYDLYIDDANLLKAWSFHRAAAPDPTLTNTFDRYIKAGPLRIATEHRNADGTFRLYFTDIKVED